MTIEAIGAFRPLQMEKLALETPSAASAAAPEGNFGSLLTESVEKLNAAQLTAGDEVKSFVTGNGPNVHTLMLDMEKANLSLEMAVQVRNKITEAYNEIMHMQV